MILWKISLRETTAHRGRAILTAASVVVGVAAVVAVRLSVASVHESFGAMQSAMVGKASLQVDAPDGGTFPEEVAADLAQVRGVEQAAPILERQSVMYFDDQRVR